MPSLSTEERSCAARTSSVVPHPSRRTITYISIGTTVVAAPRRNIGRVTEIGGRPCLCWEQIQRSRLGDRLATRVGLELAEDRRHVVAHRPGGEEQPLSDLPVAKPLRDQRKHLALARGEPCRVPAREREIGRAHV